MMSLLEGSCNSRMGGSCSNSLYSMLLLQLQVKSNQKAKAPSVAAVAMALEKIIQQPRRRFYATVATAW